MYTFEFTPKAAKHFRKLPQSIQLRVRKKLEKYRNHLDPLSFAKRVQNLEGVSCRFRVGQYRLLCRVENSICIILVVAIGHRKDIYQ